ncbi:MAG: UDP-glucose/GDP-mannose dehydrogenase family protein [Christensenellaceae bacterium]
MNLSVIGSGYVGLVTGLCLADCGHNIVCMDTDRDKIEGLRCGVLPIFEPGLQALLEKNIAAKHIKFTCDMKEAVVNSDVIFIAVGTPPMEDGSADLFYVTEVAKKIAEHINCYKVIVDKSTVPVGTGKKVQDIIERGIKQRGIQCEFDVVSNPEFLREGFAIGDFMYPDRVVIGARSEHAFGVMDQIYGCIQTKEFPIVHVKVESAELIKYASNAFLAMKLSYVNQMTELCEAVAADINEVTIGMGLDKRIGSRMLKAGPGYGGSCFPKDTRALTKIGEEVGVNISLIKDVIAVNERHKLRLANKVQKMMKSGQTIAVLGLAFKADTDDMRGASAITIINRLCELGIHIKTYDPQAMKNAKTYYFAEQSIYYAADCYDAIKDADAIMILTEWDEFKELDFDKIQHISKAKVLYDYRNLYDKKTVEECGMEYVGIGIAEKR